MTCIVFSLFGFSVGIATALACVVMDSGAPDSATELICYRGDTITEHHIGVSSASVNERGIWTLSYSDGESTGPTIYRQAEGEACMTIEEES